jgi:gliding motility-associatede transport system auxiliary component
MAVNRSLSSGTPPWIVAAYAVSLVLVFLGERVFSTLTWLREGLTGLGVVGVLALTALRWLAVRATEGERRTVERALAILSTVGALAIVVYLTTAEPFDDKLGLTRLPTETRHRYDAVANVAWIALLLCSFLPTLFAERALFPMRHAARIEWRRVRDALGGGLGLGLAAVYGALFAFVASELDVKADFSYFHTARPGESTKKIAASASEPIKVLAFFPQVNEVGTEVAGYLRDLGKSAPKLDVEIYDRLLVPQIAKDAKVSDDGVVVLERGAQRESLTIGTDPQNARPKLKSLDQDFQKSLMKVLRAKRTAYFTTGHGELNDTQPTAQNEGRTGKGIRGILEQQNYVVKDLNAASGLGTDVPEDATIVFVLGPEHPLLVEEVQSLGRYLDRGGKLFLCLDPEPKADLAPLADLVGLTVSTYVLANDKVHLRRHFNDSDRTILATNRYSSHASVSTLSRTSRPVVFLGAAALDKKPGADGALKVDFAVRAMPDTFDDENGDFKFAAPEKRQSYGLAVAVSKEPMRAFVLGDADVVTDAALTNDGNVVLVADAVRWLGGEESFAGAISTPEDVRIEHTKQKDLVWFYGTIFGAPALVLGVGLLYTRRVTRSRKRRAPAQEKLA